MPKHGKTYNADAEKIEKAHLHTLDEAISGLKQFSGRKFDQTVEGSVRLAVDSRKAEQMVRGSLILPNGTGKTQIVLVFARDAAAEAATEAGADFVGAEDLAEKIQGGWTDFDVAIATPDMMSVVGRLGRILGPRGIMPNPKTGTVTPDVAQAVNDAKGGKVDFRVDRGGNVQAPLGKLSFTEEALKENISAFFEALARAKPAAHKGPYIRSATLSGTMTPGFRIDRAELATLTK
jgi:large subunit ribosomal protein L1